jgi:hypothetical protein
MALKDKLAASNNSSCTKIKAVTAAPGFALTNLATTSQGMAGLLWTTWFFAQSAEDGTMPLLEACFGLSTNSGDFWEPSKSNNLKGPAIKVALTPECSDQESRTVLWTASEAAVGRFTM